MIVKINHYHDSTGPYHGSEYHHNIVLNVIKVVNIGQLLQCTHVKLCNQFTLVHQK